ncbi:MAG: histidine phosphatase family protein, partial [bacterium]|nr:histidine phosphatase family protein [bacterium]
CLAAFLARGAHLDPQERASAPPLDELYCSPMLRTLETARPTAESLGLRATIWVDVHEVGGVWLDGKDHCPGLGRAQIATHLPGAVVPDAIGAGGWWSGGQETASAGLGRVSGVAAQLWARARRRAQAGEPAQRIAIVSHGDFMSSMVKALTDHLPSAGIYYWHSNTGIDRFRFDPEAFRIRYLNRIDHLDDEELVSQ